MTHPMQAAAKAVIALRLSDTPHGPDEYARAAITAFLDAVDSEPRLSQFFGAQGVQHSVIAALKRIAEDAP